MASLPEVRITHSPALPTNANAQHVLSYLENYVELYEYIEELLSQRGIRNEGLNAEWSVSAYDAGTIGGLPAWLVDNEDDTYSLVTRVYRDDDNDDIQEVAEYRPTSEEEAEDMLNAVFGETV